MRAQASPDERRADNFDTELGELPPHAPRHGARLVRWLAGEDLPVDRDQRLDIARHIALLGGAMRRDQRNAVAARGLLARGAREGMQRDAIMDDTGLHRGFETAGERKAADRKHRVPELQETRQRAAVALVGPGRHRAEPMYRWHS